MSRFPVHRHSMSHLSSHVGRCQGMEFFHGVLFFFLQSELNVCISDIKIIEVEITAYS